MENRNNISKEEAIRRITEIYHADYDLNNPNFTIYDQLLACEAYAEAEEEYQKQNRTNESVSVNGNVNDNDSYKRQVNFVLNQQKLIIIATLRSFNYKTPIFEVANALQDLFKECESKPKHWVYIAEHYTPRTISRVINYMSKRYGNWKIIQNPAAYFTNVIKHRKKRKSMGTIGLR